MVNSVNHNVQDTVSVKKIHPLDKIDTGIQGYTVLWLKDGFRSVIINYNKYLLQPNTIFFLGERNFVEFEADDNPLGWMLTISELFLYKEFPDNLKINHIQIFSTMQEVLKIKLSSKFGERVHSIVEMIDELAESDHPHKHTTSASLLNSLLLYCDSQCDSNLKKNDSKRNQIHIVNTFKSLVAMHYNQVHCVSDYAEMMNISPKYLNQIVKEVLGTTAKSVIQRYLMIQARSDLKFTGERIKEIAYNLGFSDPFYFSNVFKKEMGCSPSQYREL